MKEPIKYKQSEKQLELNAHLCCIRWGGNRQELIEKFRSDNVRREDAPKSEGGEVNVKEPDWAASKIE